jgi:hypothetical protein
MTKRIKRPAKTKSKWGFLSFFSTCPNPFCHFLQQPSLSMYVLRFFVTAISSAVESIFCLCIRPGRGGETNILVSEDHEGRGAGYASMNSDVSAAEVLGLTGTYHSWFESKTAIKYAIANLGAYLVVTIIGFSFLFEQWPIIDSMYFAVVLFTTVGKGNLD